jgi:hypothetical protein
MPTPSLALIPAAYKSGKVYSVLPFGGEGDFTFTRASSATRVNQSGLIELVATGVPRLDYTGGGCPSFLFEPQSTNLITYSEDFSNADWTKTGSSITSNVIISPDGDLNGDKLSEDSNNTTHFLKSGLISSSASTYYTTSFFVKYNGRHLQILGSTGSEGGGYVNFDLINGEVGSSDQITGSIESIGNGWYICSATNITTSSATEIRLIPFLCTSKTSSRGESYAGDGISGIYLYGAQIEEQSYATSYIPTAGVTATRIADVATVDLTPFNLTSITETIGGVEQTPITIIPSTYTSPNGAINKIIME